LATVALVAKAALARRKSGTRKAVHGTAGREVAVGDSRRSETQSVTRNNGQPGPDTPLDLEAPDWKVTLKRTAKEIKTDRAPLAAAGMAYYFFLAIFPALIAVVGIMGLVDADTSGLTRAIESTLPGESGEAITEAFREADQPSQRE
jgi:membrane protein